MSRTLPQAARPSIIPPLENGDHLSRDEFERRFNATRGLKKAELIEGVVYVPPHVSMDHTEPQAYLLNCLGHYAAATPGVRFGGDGSVRLDLNNMPQPDAFLMIAQGGHAHIDQDRYIAGAPEWIGEIAATTASYDLHEKQQVYRRNGVREYLVWRTRDGAMDYFVLRQGRYERLPIDDDGIWKSECFAGLWIDSRALLAGDLAKALKTVEAGIATPEHAEFVAKLGEHL